MTEQIGQGWYDDPTRRHRTRWYDGSGWTEHIVGPDGAVARDDLRPDDRALPAPGQAPAAPPAAAATDQITADSATTVVRPSDFGQPAAQTSADQQPVAQQYPAQQGQWVPPTAGWNPPSQQQSAPQQQWGGAPSHQPAPQQWAAPAQPAPAQPTWQQPQGQQPWQQQPQGGAWGYPPAAAAGTGRVRYAPGPGIGVGAVGVVLLILSLFALDWADGGHSTFLDLRRSLGDIPDGLHLTAGQHVAVLYTSWIAFVLFGLVVVLVALAGIPLPRSSAGNTYARIAGALFAGLGAVGQMITVAQAFKGPDSPQFGAWLGVAGWIIAAAAFILGARRVPA